MWRTLLCALVLLAACTTQKSTDGQHVERSSTSTPLERAKIHTELGVRYYEIGQLGVALEELNTAVSADSSYAPAYNALGLVYMDLHEDDQADKNFRKAIKLDPSSSEAKNNYGLFLCQRGHANEGIRQLLDALKNPLYTTPDVAYKNAGLCSRKAGDIKSAETYFTKAVKLNPNQSESLFQLADIGYARDDYVTAQQYLARYMSVANPPAAEALWLGARIERKLGNRESLANYGSQLRKRYPSSPETKAFLEGRFE
ncbi:MAG TPA: type IV pilus biogenesis/stability protein PilW [Burkholderiales bacterium]|nr:type IV pilus biogenesis/stability protein PilW [Burkholderiales bacterium]